MIDGISIAGYRSFGADEVKIGELSQINVFIGKNNSGKSNVLRAVRLMADMRNATQGRPDTHLKLDPHLDYCLGAVPRGVMIGIQLRKDGRGDAVHQALTALFIAAGVRFGIPSPESLWFSFALTHIAQNSSTSLKYWDEIIKTTFSESETSRLARVLLNYTGGSHEQRSSDIAKMLHERAWPLMSISVVVVDAFRRISPAGDDRLSGSGLIQRLRQLQHPLLTSYEADTRRFNKIVGFARSILDEPDLAVEIPADEDKIYIRIGTRLLPLDNLGTGIHELVILAAAVTVVDNAIFCIEEPEIHLHLGLQKKLARYLQDETTNQYFISSHSNAFIDLPGVNVYRCWLEDGRTKCERTLTDHDKHVAISDLGYRPSDLLQANFVVWVEGPSDRIYLNLWLNAAAQDLTEGLDYSIMFYGGRLLSHLAYDEASDEGEVNDFIRLARLNRSACIIMDSDRKAEAVGLNDSKVRVQHEFEAANCFVWITQGRTIEHYVDPSEFSRVSGRPTTDSVYADLTKWTDAAGKEVKLNKVVTARKLFDATVNLDVLDLRERLDELVLRIRQRKA